MQLAKVYCKIGQIKIMPILYNYLLLACLPDQNKSSFYGRPVIIQPIKATIFVFIV